MNRRIMIKNNNVFTKFGNIYGRSLSDYLPSLEDPRGYSNLYLAGFASNFPSMTVGVKLDKEDERDKIYKKGKEKGKESYEFIKKKLKYGTEDPRDDISERDAFSDFLKSFYKAIPSDFNDLIEIEESTNKKEEIIEIQDDIEINQDGEKITLEKGDKIKVLEYRGIDKELYTTIEDTLQKHYGEAPYELAGVLLNSIKNHFSISTKKYGR